MKLILGSQSPSRRVVLEQAGYTFDVLAPDIDEKAIRSDDYRELPQLIARAKAAALLGRISEPAILVTADQVTVCNGQLREKPIDEAEARAFLHSYDRLPVQCNSAVAVTNTETGRTLTAIDTAVVRFRPFPEKVIDKVIANGVAMAAAGAFVIEDPDYAPYVKRIEGDPTTVMGLPLRLTEHLFVKINEA